jgi:uncharacterized repeat protein (TIGR03803 family)
MNDASTGTYPYGGVIFDASGNLWGTATGGGTSGDGLIYELTPPSPAAVPWTETVLHNFSGGKDGTAPDSSLLLRGGRFFGTTLRGGTMSCVAFSGAAVGCGTVFALAP